MSTNRKMLTASVLSTVAFASALFVKLFSGKDFSTIYIILLFIIGISSIVQWVAYLAQRSK